MADELTPEQQRELDAIDRALSGRAVDPELAEIAALTNELHEARATPSPEYAEELDRRAAAWLGAKKEPRRRPRLGWLRVAVPVAAAAVVAVVVVGGGDESSDQKLQLSAVSEQPRSSALAAPQEESGGGEADDHVIVGKELVLDRARVPAGEPFVVRYEVLSTVQAGVDFAGRSGDVELGPGMGRLEIGTEGVEPGTHPLSIVLRPGGSLHTRVRIAP